MAELLACRICLVTDVKLYDIFKYHLQNPIMELTGYQVHYSDNLPKHMCSCCITLLKKCVKFKNVCLTTQEMLQSAVKNNYVIADYIRSIDKTRHLTLFTITPLDITECPQTDIIIDIKEESDTKDNVINTFIDDIDVKHESDEEPLSRKVKKKRKRKKKHVLYKLEDVLEMNDSQNEFEFNDIHEFTHFNDDNDMKTVNDTNDNDMKTVNDTNDNDMKLNDIENDSDFNKDKDINDTDIEVVFLTKEQQIDEVNSRKQTHNYQNSFYKCKKCFKGFVTDGTYQNHMLRHDISSGPHICDICLSRWPDRRSLRSHKIISHERKYICKLCDHVTKSKHRAKEHSKWHTGYKFICKTCGSTFSKSTSYLTHVRLHHPSSFTCEVCGESFIGENGLNIHKKKAHVKNITVKFEHQCLLCGVQFKNIEALQQHTKLSQNEVCDTMLRPCLICGLNFPNGEELGKHNKSHQNRIAARCEECDRNFLHERSFEIHNQRVHLGIKHKLKVPDYRKRGVVVCEICGKKCITKASLVHHQRTHTGEKPFKCKECPKSFSVYQRLQIHTRTHTGERPYKCTNCPKAFKHKAALNRHDRVHSGVKPYQCPHCGKSFSQSNSMKLHVKTVHLKMPAPYRNKRINKE